jgi:hypothetical protein
MLSLPGVALSFRTKKPKRRATAGAVSVKQGLQSSLGISRVFLCAIPGASGTVASHCSNRRIIRSLDSILEEYRYRTEPVEDTFERLMTYSTIRARSAAGPTRVFCELLVL